MNKAKFTFHYGEVCPVCHELNDITAGPFTPGARTAYRQYECNKCGAKWRQRWKLQGYDALLLPKTPEKDFTEKLLKLKIGVEKQLAPGTQMAYVPLYARTAKRIFRDTEFGFIVEPKGDFFHYCRFWSKNNPAKLQNHRRPTLVSNTDIVIIRSVDQKHVNAMLDKYNIRY